jgi:hypothetical protein
MKSTNAHPEDLLPWYVNGTLAPEEAGSVAKHVSQCARCRKEVEFLKQIRGQVQGEEISAPGEFGLKRLMRDIKREKRAAPGGAPGWWRPALAAGIAVIAIQSALLANYWFTDKPITTLGAGHGNGIVVQLTFVPEAPEKEIRKVLNEINGTLIGGPGSLGVYRVRLDPETPEDKINELIGLLRARQNVVTHVARE